MNTTITGQVICAGRLKDNNGDEFHGIMIETGKDALMNRAIPLYQDVCVRKSEGDWITISETKAALIDLIIHREIGDEGCRYFAKQIEESIKP